MRRKPRVRKRKSLSRQESINGRRCDDDIDTLKTNLSICLRRIRGGSCVCRYWRTGTEGFVGQSRVGGGMGAWISGSCTLRDSLERYCWHGWEASASIISSNKIACSRAILAIAPIPLIRTHANTNANLEPLGVRSDIGLIFIVFLSAMNVRQAEQRGSTIVVKGCS